MEHINITLGEIHRPNNWEWTDQVTRLAQTVGVTEIGLFGIQLSDGTLWRLASINPTVWATVAQTAASVDSVEGLPDALADKVDKVSGKALSTNDYSTAEKQKLAGIEEDANAYTHPANHPASIITQDASNRFVTDIEKAAWNAKQPAGTYATGTGSASGVNTGDQVIPTTLPASDVYPWAKEATKPAYVKSEVGLSNVDNTSNATERTATATLTNKTLTSPDINGGTVDGAVIGGAVPAVGSFTTLSTGNIKLSRGSVINFSDDASLNNLISGGVDNNLVLWAAGAQRGSFSSTGLAVTGGISASGVGAKLDVYDASGAIATSTLLEIKSNAQSGVNSQALTKIAFHGAADVEAGYLGFKHNDGYSSDNTGIVLSSSAPLGHIAFGTNNTERMRLDASGNLGLGVTPSAWLGTAKAIQAGGSSFVGGYIAANGWALVNSNAYYSVSGDPTYVDADYASSYKQYRGIHSWYTAPSGTAGAPISFTQAMTLDAGGNLLVGKTSATVGQSGIWFAPTSNSAQFMFHANGTASGSAYQGFYYDATQIGSITQSGTTAVLYNTTSDARLKTNVINAPDAASLIDAIQVRSFDWLSDNSHQRYGFVAQELYEVAPEAVSKPQDPDEMMAVDYSKLVPMLVKEVQSLRARVSQLEGI